MVKELKNIFMKFCFVNFIICCVLMFSTGAIIAKQKSAYNLEFQQYAVLSMKANGEKIEMTSGDKVFNLSLEQLGLNEALKKYAVFTPFYCLIHFIEDLSEYKG